MTRVPWKELIRYAPQMIDRTERVIGLIRASRAARVDPDAADDAALIQMAKRIDALEQSVVAQAELLSQAAAQQADLSRALRVLSTRVTIALWLSGTVLLAVIVAVLVRLL
jgi:hypothetical protein